MATVRLSSDRLVLEVEGDLDFNSVPLLHDAADKFIQETAIPVFDFGRVTQTESAALALLTTWYRKSQRLGKTPQFLHLPPKLMEVVGLSGLDKILALSE